MIRNPISRPLIGAIRTAVRTSFGTATRGVVGSVVRGVIVIPLTSSPNWHHSQFRNIPSNDVSFKDNFIYIGVSSSASPLFYRLNRPLSVSEFQVELAISGKLSSIEGSATDFTSIPAKKESFPEDFIFRLGLVEPGERKVGWFERFLAPQWILDLEKLFSGKGLGRIRFYNLGESNSKVGSKKVLEKFDYVSEEIAAIRASQPEQYFQVRLDQPFPAEALWVSCEGDHSKSKFQIVLKKILLKTND